ncbi:MAG: gluconokinase, partial [Chloroflexia bacterium]|nr:gluconokinase [Chloroflexia bacterium]
MMAPVSRQEAVAPLVLAIDIGSSSIRALLFDGHGRQLQGSETQLSHELVTSPDGGSEADAAALLDLTLRCIDGAVRHAATHSVEIGAVGVSCFWHSLLGVDRNGDPTTPVLMWSDKRAGPDVATLRDRIDAETLHQETGCRPHSSYWPAKLLWLQRTDPDAWNATRGWLSFADFVTRRLQGDRATSLSMASGTGLFDTARLDWHDNAMIAAGVDSGTMPTLIDRDVPLPPLLPQFASRWPALAAIPWFPAIGDGAAANVGAGCVGRDRIAVTVGTSAAMRMIIEHAAPSDQREKIPDRIWCYLLDRTHKVLGGALSNGGNVTEWLAGTMAGGGFEELTESAARLGPDAHGLTLLPFLAGERSPSWNDSATGTLSGVTLSTTSGDIYRAALEATAYRIAAIHDDLRPLAADACEIHANGSAVLNSPLWLQIIADTLGRRVDAE